MKNPSLPIVDPKRLLRAFRSVLARQCALPMTEGVDRNLPGFFTPSTVPRDSGTVISSVALGTRITRTAIAITETQALPPGVTGSKQSPRLVSAPTG